MFNDKYGLTAAVLNGEKTMTRRIVNPNILPKITEMRVLSNGTCQYEDPYIGKWYNSSKRSQPKYKVGEIVAVAQKYLDLCNCDAFYEALSKADPSFPLECIEGEKGCHNKMFVKAEWMPHRIRITDIKVERLQDISDEDCLKEGIDWIIGTPGILKKWTFFGTKKTWNTRREAFAALIDKVSGKGTWENNPFVFAYSFELID